MRVKKRSRTSRKRVEVVARGVDQTREEREEEMEGETRKIEAELSRSCYQCVMNPTLLKRRWRRRRLERGLGINLASGKEK